MRRVASQKMVLLINFLALSALLIAQPKYEFRAVWIASVDNIDWPIKGMVNVDSQKNEYIRQLDMHHKNGMNAVIVQVRPAADAFYPSAFEPWSQWLTGVQGKPPSPYYDPLEFMIKEAHQRGMEFHAWCNPYRADFKIGASSIGPSHITRLHPEWFLDYGDKKYFDPGSKLTQQFVVNVIADIVSRYDVDAIHMDDYFYPYRIAGKEFPDSLSYVRSKSPLSKDDWRRSNVDSIIRQLSLAIKKENKHCRFGISPFSVWRNKSKDPEGSESTAGQTNYDDLYADILLWLKKGWIDYVAPQLYFEIGNPRVPYEKMLDWWASHAYGKHVYIGHGIYRAGGAGTANAPFNKPEELPRQIVLLRQNSNVHGSIYFSSKSFNKNPNGWNDSLQQNYYKFPALISPMDWVDNTKPRSPNVNRARECCKINIDSQNNPFLDIKYYVIYKNCTADPANDVAVSSFYKIVSPQDGHIIQIEGTCKMRVSVVAVSKTNVESDPTTIELDPAKSPFF